MCQYIFLCSSWLTVGSAAFNCADHLLLLEVQHSPPLAPGTYCCLDFNLPLWKYLSAYFAPQLLPNLPLNVFVPRSAISALPFSLWTLLGDFIRTKDTFAKV